MRSEWDKRYNISDFPKLGPGVSSLSAYTHSSSCFLFFLPDCVYQRMSGREHKQDVNIYLQRQHTFSGFCSESIRDTQNKGTKDTDGMSSLVSAFNFETIEQDWNIGILEYVSDSEWGSEKYLNKCLRPVQCGTTGKWFFLPWRKNGNFPKFIEWCCRQCFFCFLGGDISMVWMYYFSPK